MRQEDDNEGTDGRARSSLCSIRGPINSPDGWRRVLYAPPLQALRHLAFRWRSAAIILVVLLAAGILTFFDIGPLPPEATTSLATLTVGDTWATPGRDPQNTAFAPVSTLGMSQEAELIFHVPAGISSSPAVTRSHIFLATKDNRLLALDRQSRKVAWDFQASTSINSGPVVVGNLVVIGLLDGSVVSLDSSSGQESWRFGTDDSVVGAGIAADGTLYIGSGDHRLYALDAGTGQERWRFDVGAWIISSIAYIDEKVVVVSKQGLLHVIDARTGRKRLVYDLGWPVTGAPAVNQHHAYVATDSGVVWVIDHSAITYPFERAWSSIRWRLFLWGAISHAPMQKGTVWSEKIPYRMATSPALDGEMMYVAARSGAAAFSADSGALKWEVSLDSTPASATDIVITRDATIFGTSDGFIYVLDKDTGEQRARIPVDGGVACVPAVTSDQVFVATDKGKLYSIPVQ